MGAYCASKAVVIRLTESMAAELREKNINVNCVLPTTLDTPRLDVVILENPSSYGPFGAKGVGEMPIDGPAPAVITIVEREAAAFVRAKHCRWAAGYHGAAVEEGFQFSRA